MEENVNYFCALDVETANEQRSSICQLGIVKFNADGTIVDEFKSFCFQEYFSPFNVSIHGIEESDVVGAIKFPELLTKANIFIDSLPVVAHSGFDRSAFNAASRDYGIKLPVWTWYDSCQLARRLWPELKNHKLKTICEELNIEFRHHDALADAFAAGKLICHAMREKKVKSMGDLYGQLFVAHQQNQKSRSSAAVSIKQTGKQDGILFGETIVFTGEYRSNDKKINRV